MIKKVTFFNKSFYDLVRYLYLKLENKFKIIKLIVEHLEVNRIMKSKLSKVVVIYDNYTAPPTYGDFVIVLFLCRYLICIGKSVDLLITIDNFRSDWYLHLNEEERGKFVRDQKKLGHQLLSHGARITLIDKSNIKNFLINNNDSMLLFPHHVKIRKCIYSYSFNTLNLLFIKSKNRNFLINPNEFIDLSSTLKRTSLNSYVVFAVRFNNRWSQERNINPKIFLEISEKIKKRFNLPIVIVSDEFGSRYVKDFLRELGINSANYIFSKDYATSFYEDIQICLYAKYYFQFRGGGIGIFPMMSNSPYLIYDSAANERTFKDRNACSWALGNQIRCFSTDLESFLADLNNFPISHLN